MGKIYQVTIHGYRGEKMLVDLCNTEEQMQNMTVLQLKEKIAQRIPESTGQESISLIFADKRLEEDSETLSKYGVQHMSVIHMTLKLPGGLRVLLTASTTVTATADAAPFKISLHRVQI